MTVTATNMEALRQGWEDAVSELAPAVSELPVLLDARLNEAARDGRFDELSLLQVVDEARRVANQRMAAPDAAALARRMKQAVYEFLLSLDAVVAPSPEAPVDGTGTVRLRDTVLIGAEEVAQTATADAPAADAEDAVAGDALAMDAAESDMSASEAPAEPAPAPRRRFTLFRTSGSRTVGNGADAGGPPSKAFMAPKDGFHITDLPEADAETEAAESEPEAAEAASTPAEPAPATAEDEAEQNGDAAGTDGASGEQSRSWRQKLRLGKRPEDDELTASPEAGESRFHTDPAVLESRRQINDRLRHRRCDDAASLLQRLSAEVGGREVAELALDAGDRCRALGKANAALSCYLAASRADPVHEPPLLRLADICIDDKDIELAVTYLERVARLHRLREDDKGALRIYRKIATIAPYREDILNLLMHVQATGRFQDE